MDLDGEILKILVTGAGGFIGQGVVNELSKQHEVVALTTGPEHSWMPKCVRGNFTNPEDLKKLDDYNIEAAVHLAAVTGGAPEQAAFSGNVLGTRTLLRYLANRGCKKIVCASSIAAIGFQNTKFRPLAIPIPDEHPCLDRDGYGVSKFLMEEVTRYIQRSVPDLDIINLRLSSVTPNGSPNPLVRVSPLGMWSLGTITLMSLRDAVTAFTLAVESNLVPGVRTMNAAGPRAWVNVPVATVLRNWYGADIDVSYFDKKGHEWAGVFDVTKIRNELGFIAQDGPEVYYPESYPGPAGV